MKEDELLCLALALHSPVDFWCKFSSPIHAQIGLRFQNSLEAPCSRDLALLWKGNVSLKVNHSRFAGKVEKYRSFSLQLGNGERNSQ